MEDKEIDDKNVTLINPDKYLLSTCPSSICNLMFRSLDYGLKKENMKLFQDKIGKIKRKKFRRFKSNYFRSKLNTIDECFSGVTSSDMSFSSIAHCFEYSGNNNWAHRLCHAVLFNVIATVEMILHLGKSPNCYDEHKRTPLHIAVSKGYTEIVRLLLLHGADPNIKDGLGNSCLHLAACTNNIEIASLLIQEGADVDLLDMRGRSPLQLAQAKLRILQNSPDPLIKEKLSKLVDMLVMYFQKCSNKMENKEETELLSSFQSRLQITDNPEQISNEIDNLSKLLSEVETLSIK